ncbi:MAG: bifunctional DNA-formamidopyrimidine glycosylase/DNA-(apurinic or apyrimidinic site) lyase [Solirubrobacterales bacterium]
MPELPEVETIRRQLEPAIRGRVIRSVEVLDDRWTRPEPPRSIERALSGRAIEAVERRGKYLLLRLSGDRALAMHLRMTGNLLLQDPGSGLVADLESSRPTGGPRLYESDPALRHLRATIELDDGTRVLFTDPRRFGQAVVLDGSGVDEYMGARLGIEPLSGELTAEALCRLAAGRRAPLKSFLLDQRGIAGIGNIYADEALHRAALHPLSPAGSMKPEDCARLRDAIVVTLEAGLRNGGASIDDYLDARGERGAMQDEFLVHTREGDACPRCGAEIRRIVVAGRSTYFCPSCQRRLRRRPRRRARLGP